MYKKAIYRLFSLILLLLSITAHVKAQDLLRNYDLSSVKVDKLSDADILKFKQQLTASGLTQQQAEQIAISKGMPISEIQKLRLRLQQLSISNQGNQISNNNNNQPTGLNYPEDTSLKTNNIDTTSRKPLINPRIF